MTTQSKMLQAGKNMAFLCKKDLVRTYLPLMVNIHSWKVGESWKRTALTTCTNQLIDEFGMELMMIAEQCGWKNWHQADFVHYLTSGDLGWYIASWILETSPAVSRFDYEDNQLVCYSKHSQIDTRSEEYGLGSFQFACAVYAGMFADNLKNKEAQKAKLFGGGYTYYMKLWPSMSQRSILEEMTNATTTLI